jgi:hypothetical protein
VVCIDYPTSHPQIGSEPCVSDDLIRIASNFQPTDAVPVDEPSLLLPESEHVEDSRPITDPATAAECQQPIPMTDTVTEEPSAPITSQEDATSRPVSVSGDYFPSQPEDKVDVPMVDAAQTSEDRQTGGSSFTCWIVIMSHHLYRPCSGGERHKE